MNSIRTTGLGATFAALLFGVAPVNATLAADAAPVAAQQLVAPTASSKVTAVLWTRRAEGYTLQVVFPRPTVGIRIEPIKNDTSVTLWLLKADGTAIPTQADPPRKPAQGAVSSDLTYRVPLLAGDAAVAAVLKIDEAYFIEALRPLK